MAVNAATPRPRRSRFVRPLLGLAAGLVLVPATLPAQGRVTSPKEFFGFDIGDDYRLANYTKFSEYWRKIDAESDRMVVEEIGKTAEGRPQLMAIITSPDNHRQLARYKDIARRLALAEGLTDEQARELAREGKAVVWFDGGLHATEVLGSHQLIETTYRLLSENDPETQRFLDDLIILAVHANPDGMELVADWYMREPDEKKRSTGGIPRLYQKYIGHDNNRDFYMLTQPESFNVARIQYKEWFPQIVYNHHQTGPAGSVLFAPPFRDPHNHNFDPLIPLGINLVGASMHSRFAVENKPGATMREGAGYQTWWNGGLRTAVYFHNMIGLLTETIGNPTPIEIPFTPQKLISTGDYPYPITPQRWHFRQSIEYSVTANKAVFDIASRHREQFLFNIYRMGKNSIERGSTDTWTFYPKRIAQVQDSIAKDRARQRQEQSAGGNATLNFLAGFGGTAPTQYFSMLRDPALRDPRAYVIPADQRDFLTATKFVNTLMKAGVAVHQATGAFSVGGKRYPAGSYVVRTAQAFRPHVIDMFEPQDYPNDLQYPGGPPKPPYDNAGYTLAYQMGVQFDRILDGFDAPLQPIQGEAKVPAGTVANAQAQGYVLSHVTNDAFLAVNRLLKSGHEVYWMQQPATVGGRTHAAGSFYIAGRQGTGAALQGMATELGLSFEGVTSRPAGDALRLRPTRIGLWDVYGGSMPSGWTRWLFEQYEFPFEVVYAPTLDAGNLNAKYDVLVFVDGAIPEQDRAENNPFGGRQPDAASVPAQYRGTLGRVSVAKTVPQLRAFMENGGTVITIGSSTVLAEHLGLPVGNHLVERAPGGAERPLPREKMFVPGSVLSAAVDSTHPLAHGMPGRVDVFFDNSPVFRLEPNAAQSGVRAVAWFDRAEPLRSGWAWGQAYLQHGTAVAEADVGRGKLFLFGPEVANRAQPHGTFKFLFNGIYYGPAAARADGSATSRVGGRSR